MKVISKIPFHPVFFATYPILSLYGVNVLEVTGTVIWRPLLIALAGMVLLESVFRLLLRDWFKASFATSLFLLIFFTYGRIYDALKTTRLVELNIIRHRYLVVLMVSLFALCCWLMLRYVRNFRPVTGILNSISILMVLLPIIQISSYQIKSSSGGQSISKWVPASNLVLKTQPADRPDVYYIILDSHARSDVLKIELGLDNSEFIRQLEEMNFYVANCSRSNYNQTLYSMVSSLNMNYMPDIYTEGAKQGLTSENIWLLIKYSTVRKSFESLGYKSVAFDTGYKWTSVDDVDLFLTRGKDAYGVQFINPFEQMLVDTTALSIYNDYLIKTNRDKYYGASHINANYIGQEEFILDQLPKIPEIADLTFTYAHISVPHHPYVFSPKGYLIDPGEIPATGPDEVHFPLGYIYQVQFIDTRILTILQEIIEKSRIPPIIILQADHGYWTDEDGGITPILNAYFLPGFNDDMLYPTISPVNTFRLIFNLYFDGQYELLPDQSFTVKDISRAIPEVYPDCQ
jgi:hypothetical protein